MLKTLQTVLEAISNPSCCLSTREGWLGRTRGARDGKVKHEPLHKPFASSLKRVFPRGEGVMGEKLWFYHRIALVSACQHASLPFPVFRRQKYNLLEQINFLPPRWRRRLAESKIPNKNFRAHKQIKKRASRGGKRCGPGGRRQQQIEFYSSRA